jgi:hypothetical protein
LFQPTDSPNARKNLPETPTQTLRKHKVKEELKITKSKIPTNKPKL